ncbi:MAG: 6-bladed beta-propeller [Rikenellaceae bacterium]
MTLIMSCSAADKGGEKDYRVVDMSKMQQESVEIDKLFDNKKYIILDDSKDFYPARIEDVLVRGNRLYIHSYMRRNSKLLVFDLDGNPIMSVGAMGKAENEYLDINGYDIAPNGDICINDLLGRKLLTFDKDGNFIKSNRDIPTDIYHIKLIEDGKYLCGLTPWNVTEGKKDLILLDIK